MIDLQEKALKLFAGVDPEYFESKNEMCLKAILEAAKYFDPKIFKDVHLVVDNNGARIYASHDIKKAYLSFWRPGFMPDKSIYNEMGAAMPEMSTYEDSFFSSVHEFQHVKQMYDGKIQNPKYTEKYYYEGLDMNNEVMALSLSFSTGKQTYYQANTAYANLPWEKDANETAVLAFVDEGLDKEASVLYKFCNAVIDTINI